MEEGQYIEVEKEKDDWEKKKKEQKITSKD